MSLDSRGSWSSSREVDQTPHLASIEEIIEDARAGRMFILVDDEDRENEGDLVIPAQHCDAAAINFMATHGRGLVCLALTEARASHLGLQMMVQGNRSRRSTAFTVSIEAVQGVTTGISAADRARTIATAIDRDASQRDVTSPGHVFPLVAREGGVLVRSGHTEAAVDISRLAGLDPSGVICEIMNDDGTMARMSDLEPFAAGHGLRIARIADLIAYRLRRERLVRHVVGASHISRYGSDVRVEVYADVISGVEHLAIVKGDIRSNGPVTVRVQTLSLLDDILGRDDGDPGGVEAAMRQLEREGRGVLVVLRRPMAGGLGSSLRGERAETLTEQRVLGIGAQILADLGVRDMRLLSDHPRPLIGIEGFGLRVVEVRPLRLAA
ncbi:MAG: 3,4-dihydroxy-2-butanone-4-phosphate synthase [Geminicoccaceae bacterium]